MTLSSLTFSYADPVLQSFPELVSGALRIDGIDASGDAADAAARFRVVAEGRLAGRTEGDLPEIQAWRRAFSRMGLRPTQYRCASESLLRRFRKEGALPSIHPLVDLCNAASLAFAIPVAAFDLARIAGNLQVRHAGGTETHHSLAGEPEHPAAGEVIFADDAGHAHARRWTHRQSGLSAIRRETSAVLVVAEAMHEGAAGDVSRLVAAIGEAVPAIWPDATVMRADDR